MSFSRSLPLIGMALGMALGCTRGDPPSEAAGDVFLRYADLPGLSQTHHRGLQDELAQLVAEQATPKLLDGIAIGDAGDGAAPWLDLIQVLEAALSPSGLQLAAGRAERLFDGDRFRWDLINLERAYRIRQDYDQQRLAIRRGVLAPSATVRMQLSRGVGVDLAFIDAARLYNRLEMFQAAEQLAVGDIPASLQTCAAMLRLAELLGRQKHVVSRMTAAGNRQEVWQIVQVLAIHAQTTSDDLDQLHQLVAEQLDRWPSDADCWIGDRAQGLHMYEMIRDGHLASLFTGKEFARHQEDGTLTLFTSASSRSLDEDQFFYLKAMRQIIDGCQHPFHRRAVFDQIRRELQKRRDSPQYPLIADRLLLSGIEDGHRRQAADRAWAQAWDQALSAALGHSPPTATNPLTGQPYRLEIGDEQITVSRIDPYSPGAQVVVSRPPAMVALP